MRLQIQIECTSPGELAAIAQALQALKVIASEDNPSAGFPPDAPAAAPGMPNAGFGVGVTLPAGATPAPSSAAATPLPTAPVVPPASSIAPSMPPAPLAPAAPPAPPAAAPTAAAVPPGPAPAAGSELDRDGLPWDARIHAATKTKNKDGTWRQKRELDPAVRAAVEAELKAALSVQAAIAGAGLPFAAPAPAAAAQPQLTPAQATAAAPGASLSDAAPPWTFASFSEKLVPLTLSGQVTEQALTAALQRQNLTSITQLALAPAVIPAIAAELGMTQ